jgi:hypothetical protein
LLADPPLDAGIVVIYAIPGKALQRSNHKIADFLELSDPESTTSPGGRAQRIPDVAVGFCWRLNSG